MKRIPLLLGATGLALALATVSCTTLGTHVKGGFACKAPQGTCAPMSNIDAQAIAGLGASGAGAMPIATDRADGPARFINTAGEGVPVRTGEHVIRVVFPAHTDGRGVYHEEAVAHLVTDRSIWTLRSEEPPTAGSLDAAIVSGSPSATPSPAPASVSASASEVGAASSNLPLNLREAAAGLTAPADPAPDAPREQVAIDMPGSPAALPSAAAIAVARAGHRIGDPMPAASTAARQHALSTSGSGQHHNHVASGSAPATVPGAATAALNREVLRNLRPAPATPSAPPIHAAGTEPATHGHEVASAGARS